MKEYGALRATIAAILLLAGGFVAGFPVGPLPPLGEFLNPATGIWSVARSATLSRDASGIIPGLEHDTRVVYDRRGVPHIWATSVDDVMRALGYVVARDRLFQMELQTRAVAGRLTELVGEQALRADREQRELGLAWSAEREFATLDPTSEVHRAVTAYADGVNAWIEHLTSRDRPFEYHFLGTTPLPWRPVYTAYLLKRMGYTLTHDRHELWRSDVEDLVGAEAAAALFPTNNPIQEPIQPNGGSQPRFDFVEPPPPQPAPLSTTAQQRRPAESPQHAWSSSWAAPELGIGSNNWAVMPERSETGFALLAGDPHLSLTLPSIWYEAHLVVPGVMDAYGVTIPGSPGIIIGFNRDAAWSMTNTGADVLDYFREEFDDDETPSTYLVDGAWRPLETRVEAYLDPNGDQIVVDTLYVTHRGPVIREYDRSLSVRWTALDDTRATASLLDGSQASSVAEFLTATETYLAPPQNMVVADREGNIAIRSTGRFPLRDDDNGWSVRDGTRSTADWSGEWPIAALPLSMNPAQGYVASANQQPTDPRTRSPYLGVNWPSPWRAMRINQLLRADTSVTPDDMRRYQTDPGNARADWFVPLFLDASRAADATPELREAAGLLAEWDRRYTKDNERAILFELAMEELADRTWDELVPTNGGRRVATPGSAILAQLTAYPTSVWWDSKETPALTETRDDVFRASLVAALQVARSEYGSPEDGGWRWSAVRHANDPRSAPSQLAGGTGHGGPGQQPHPSQPRGDCRHLTRIRGLSTPKSPSERQNGNDHPSECVGR